MIEENGTSVRIQQVERRMDKSEDDRAEIWRHLGALENRIAVLTTRVDVLTRSVDSVKRAMWSLTIGCFSVVIALATLIVRGG